MSLRDDISQNATRLERQLRILERSYARFDSDENDCRTLADQVASGVVTFNGIEEVQVGTSGIDWNGTHVNHQEWSAQLNRFFCLIPLTYAYRETKDEKYANAARSYIEDWLHFRAGRELESMHDGDNTLTISIRLGNTHSPGWSGVLPIFLDSPAFDDQLIDRILASIERQTNFLSTHLSSKGNWRISQLDALVITALRFPFLESAADFLRIGSRGMRAAAVRQFWPDGTHEELSPNYHFSMTKVMCDYYLLAQHFPEIGEMPITKDKLIDACKFYLHSHPTGINDSYGMLELTEKWPGLDQCVRYLSRLENLPSKDLTPRPDQIYPNGGYVFTGNNDESICFDSSAWTGVHSHLSRLALTYRSHGRVLIMDPGIFNYEPSDPFMAYGRSTKAHNTLNVNGFNQGETAATLVDADLRNDFALIHAKYEGGYWQGDYHWNFENGHGKGAFGSHERILFWRKGEYFLVLDSLRTDPGEIINNCWQLAPMRNWDRDEDRQLWWSKHADVNLHIQMLKVPAKMTMQCHEGETKPEIRGWIGEQGFKRQKAPLLEFSYPGNERRRTISALLVASYHDQRPEFIVRKSSPSSQMNVQYLEFSTPQGYTDYLVWTPSLREAVESPETPLVSDATLAWCRTDQSGQVVDKYIHNGSYFEFEG